MTKDIKKTMNLQILLNKKAVKIFLLIILSLLCGILDYFICDLVAWKLRIPLFCDTIFIMSISFVAGPFWGVLAGFFYHVFDVILSGEIVLGQVFMICHFIAALIAGFYKRAVIKETDTSFGLFIKISALAILMCLAMSISGGIISFILSKFEAYKDGTSQTDFLSFLLENKINQKLLLDIVVRIPVNLEDRFVCVFAAWGINYLVVKKILKDNYKSFFNS